MSFLQVVIMFFRFFPELKALIETLSKQIESGVSEMKLRHALKTIDSAFVNPDRVAAAKALNDCFRNL